MKNHLLDFYNSVSAYTPIYELELTEKKTRIKWVELIDYKERKIKIGITNNGSWVLVKLGRIYLLDQPKYFLYCLPMLELTIESIVKEINRKFNRKKKVFDTNIIFPFYEIIEFALKNVFSDYWLERGIIWYDNLETSKKLNVEYSLRLISVDKRFSQKNRNKVKNELKLLQESKEKSCF